MIAASRVARSVALVLLPLSVSIASAQTGEAFPIHFGPPESRVLDGIGTIIAAAATPDGALVVVDHAAAAVVAYGETGRVVWRFGRKGNGPGEFQMPYRVAACPDGAVVVFDRGRNDLTWIAATGAFVARRPLPVSVSQVNQIVCPDARHMVLAASSRDGALRDHGVHVFAVLPRSLRYLRSFGMLPPTRDEQVRASWGSGSLTLASGGDLLYTPRLPYRVFRFDLAGTLRGEGAGPSLPGRPDQAFRIERSAGGMTISNGADVVTPRATHDLGAYLLGSHGNGEGARLDLFDRALRHRATRAMPSGWEGILAVDARRRMLWVRGGEAVDGPVVLRVPFRVASPPSPRRS